MHLNKIIHEESRLRIITYLAASDKVEAGFNELKEKLNFSSGNLSVQLKRLKEADYIIIHKTYKNNKPFTIVQLTSRGREALESYLSEMETIIRSFK